MVTQKISISLFFEKLHRYFANAVVIECCDIREPTRDHAEE